MNLSRNLWIIVLAATVFVANGGGFVTFLTEDLDLDAKVIPWCAIAHAPWHMIHLSYPPP